MVKRSWWRSWSRTSSLLRNNAEGRESWSITIRRDAEKDRRPLYQKLIASGRLKPGYACDNNAGVYFEDNEVKRVVASRAGAKVYYVSLVNGKVVERALEPEMIS